MVATQAPAERHQQSPTQPFDVNSTEDYSGTVCWESRLDFDPAGLSLETESSSSLTATLGKVSCQTGQSWANISFPLRTVLNLGASVFMRLSWRLPLLPLISCIGLNFVAMAPAEEIVPASSLAVEVQSPAPARPDEPVRSEERAGSSDISLNSPPAIASQAQCSEDYLKEKSSGRRTPNKIDWCFLGLELTVTEPKLAAIVPQKNGKVAVSFVTTDKPGAGGTIIYDVRAGLPVQTVHDSVPLSLADHLGNLAGFSDINDALKLIIRQEKTDGSFGTRIARVPLPSMTTTGMPYVLSKSHFAPDGALIMLSSGRDRFYRVNFALNSARPIIPSQPLNVIDFDVTTEGDLIALDAFEEQLVKLNLDGDILSATPLSKRDGPEPRIHFLSIASGDNGAAWVGAAALSENGSMVPEVHRIDGKLRERRPLVGAHGSGFPILLASDRQGGVYAVDEQNWVYHLSASSSLVEAWTTTAGVSSKMLSQPNSQSRTAYLTDVGFEIMGLGDVMAAISPDLDHCYTSLTQVSPGTSGHYRIELSTKDRGIDRVLVYKKNFSDYGLESCVADAFRKAHFPSRVGQQNLRVLVQFGR